MNHLDAVRADLITLDVRDKNWSAALAAAQADGPEVELAITQLSTPIFTVDLDAVAANLAAMQSWVDDHGAVLAPHGKTTMCPALWHWQLQQGSWAITVANEAQLRVARAARIPRVLVANEYLSPQGLSWLVGELDRDDAFDVTVWVDSADCVEQMTAQLAAAGAVRPLAVCVEIGHPAARTGVRDYEQAMAIARAVVESPRLQLRGVAAYEGSVPSATPAERPQRVIDFLTEVGRRFEEIAPLVESDEAMVTAGGSAFFDLVVEVLGPVASRTPNSRLVLRSGAYVVHDDGMYAGLTPSAERTGPTLQAAAHVWARVISTPEPDLVLLDVGKRDIPYDSGLPIVQKIITAAGELIDAPPATLFSTNDQHAYLRTEQAAALSVGQVVRLGLSHPCTMFDKWRSVLLVEGRSPRVRGVVPTYF